MDREELNQRNKALDENLVEDFWAETREDFVKAIDEELVRDFNAYVCAAKALTSLSDCEQLGALVRAGIQLDSTFAASRSCIAELGEVHMVVKHGVRRNPSLDDLIGAILRGR